MTEIVNQPLLQSNSMNMPFVAEERMRQERLENFHYDQKRIQEHNNKKVLLDKQMLEAYYEKLDRYALYTRNKELQSALADQGKIIDIEVR